MGVLQHLPDLTADATRPSVRHVLSAALPSLGAFDRGLLRIGALAGCANVRSVVGTEHISELRDPFIIALNHTSRLEALYVPALLMLLRGGRRIHFLADWNFRMIPGVDLIYRRAGVITVPNKRARPRFLGVLKPLFTDDVAPMTRAQELLTAGHSVGVFPEGRVNRDPNRLLRGRLGAARLSLETGIPIVPAGLQLLPATDAVHSRSRLSIVIGAPLAPPVHRPSDVSDIVHDWHAQIMTAIARLSRKSPALQARRRSDEIVPADENQARPVRA